MAEEYNIRTQTQRQVPLISLCLIKERGHQYYIYSDNREQAIEVLIRGLLK